MPNPNPRHLWSVKFPTLDACRACKSQAHKHHADGLCAPCHSIANKKTVREAKYTKPMQDGRRVIDPKLHPEVKRIYNELQSYQKTANHFNISKRAAIFIIRPELYQAHKERVKLKQPWLKYYDTKKNRLYMRTYRAKKRKLGYIIPQTYQ